MTRPRDLEHVADLGGDRLVPPHLHAHDAGDDVAGDVVLGRAEAAAADHGIAALQRLADAALDAAEVVADLDLEMRVDAGQRELLADPGRVAVDDDAEQKLGPDGNHLATHLGAPVAIVSCRRNDLCLRSFSHATAPPASGRCERQGGRQSGCDIAALREQGSA